MISIITPLYNAELYIAETIESVLNQSYTNWEYIIVDDGSQDKSAIIAERFADLDNRIHVVHQQNSGIASARNKGILASNPMHPFLAFLDNDDTWNPETLEILLNTLNDAPYAVGAHGIARFINSSGNPIKIGMMEAVSLERMGYKNGKLIKWPVEAPTTFETLVYLNPIPSSAVLIRRHNLAIAGGFDQTLAGADDYDMWLRLAIQGVFAFTPKVILNYRRHLNNVSNDDAMMSAQDFRVRSKLATNHALSRKQRGLVRKGWHSLQMSDFYYRKMWAKECMRQGQYLECAKQIRHAIICLFSTKKLEQIHLSSNK